MRVTQLAFALCWCIGIVTLTSTWIVRSKQTHSSIDASSLEEANVGVTVDRGKQLTLTLEVFSSLVRGHKRIESPSGWTVDTSAADSPISRTQAQRILRGSGQRDSNRRDSKSKGRQRETSQEKGRHRGPDGSNSYRTRGSSFNQSSPSNVSSKWWQARLSLSGWHSWKWNSGRPCSKPKRPSPVSNARPKPNHTFKPGSPVVSNAGSQAMNKNKKSPKLTPKQATAAPRPPKVSPTPAPKKAKDSIIAVNTNKKPTRPASKQATTAPRPPKVSPTSAPEKSIANPTSFPTGTPPMVSPSTPPPVDLSNKLPVPGVPGAVPPSRGDSAESSTAIPTIGIAPVSVPESNVALAATSAPSSSPVSPAPAVSQSLDNAERPASGETIASPNAIVMPPTATETQETEADSLEERPASLDESTMTPTEIETQVAEKEVSQQTPGPESEVSQPPITFIEDPLQSQEPASSLVDLPEAPASPVIAPVASPGFAGTPAPVFLETLPLPS